MMDTDHATVSNQMKNEREAIRMLEGALEAAKVSFDGREPGDIFVFMQEVDAILSRFFDDDLSENGRCRVAISGMKSPAKETTATNVQVGTLSDEVYLTFADALFDLYMKSAIAIKTNIRIWNLNQKANTSSRCSNEVYLFLPYVFPCKNL